MIDYLYGINTYNSDEESRRPKTIRFRPNHFEECDQKDFLVALVCLREQ
jgi:hypothetical protein